MTPIKNLIFDFGGVLVDLDFRKALSQLTGAGMNPEDFVENSLSQGIFQLFNIGNISEEDFFNGLKEKFHIPATVSTSQLKTIWNEILVDIPTQRFEAILTLKKQYNVYLLSNVNVTHWEYSKQHLWNYKNTNFLLNFKQLFLSYEMHKEKPNTDIFEEALRQAQLNPKETLFIDDRLDNVKAAKSVGLNTLNALGDEWIAPLTSKKLYAEDLNSANESR